jgi:secreted trypsin-like serine protease
MTFSASSSFSLGLRALPFFIVATITTCNAQFPSIVGGRKAPSGSYPFFVQGFGCGGSLILPDVVLTAAHCVATPGFFPTFLIGESVIVGNTELDTVTDGAQLRQIISAIQVHPLWDGNFFNGYDFALFQIENVTMPGLVPVSLNFDSCHPSGGEAATVIGFGITSGPPGNISNDLLEVDLTYVSNEVCQQVMRQGFPADPELSSVVISETMVCAGYKVGEPVAAQCSGEPLAVLLIRSILCFRLCTNSCVLLRGASFNRRLWRAAP